MSNKDPLPRVSSLRNDVYFQVMKSRPIERSQALADAKTAEPIRVWLDTVLRAGLISAGQMEKRHSLHVPVLTQ
jgi:hypothetical protein